MTTYKTCAVPMCRSTTIKCPSKIFIHVPLCPQRRKDWLQLARRDTKFTSDKSPIYFCEDHFDLPNDMENYIQYSVMGSVGKKRMKPGCLPSKFECQPGSIKVTGPPQRRSAVSNRPCTEVIEDRFSQESVPATPDMTIPSDFDSITEKDNCVPTSKTQDFNKFEAEEQCRRTIENTLQLEHVDIKNEPPWDDMCVNDELCLNQCVKDEPSSTDVCVNNVSLCEDVCVKDEPSCSEARVKDEPLCPEDGARGVSEAAAAARLYADHVVKEELELGPEEVQPRRGLHGQEDNPIGRLRFSNNLSSGHFDVYLPCAEPDLASPTYTDPTSPIYTDSDHANSIQINSTLFPPPSMTQKEPIQLHSSSSVIFHSPKFTQFSDSNSLSDSSAPQHQKRQIKTNNKIQTKTRKRKSNLSRNSGKARAMKVARKLNEKTFLQAELSRIKGAMRVAARRAAETPEESQARRRQHAEYLASRRAAETPEESQTRRRQQADYLAPRRAAETPEESQTRRRQHAEYLASRRAAETPEESQARRRHRAEYLASRRAAETPEETQTRRRQHAEYLASRRAAETPEETQTRRRQHAEYLASRRAAETPEESQTRRRQHAEYLASRRAAEINNM